MNNSDKHTGKILIAGNDPAESKLIGSIVSKSGFIPAYEINTDEVLNKARGNNPVLIILGTLPDGALYKLLDRLKGNPEYKDTPVICICDLESLDREKIFSHELSDYILKPLIESEIISKIKPYLPFTADTNIQTLTEKLAASDLELKNTLKTAKLAGDTYITLLSAAMDGFCLTDIKGNILEVNDTYCRMCGYTSQELLSMNISELEAIETESDTITRLRKISSQGENRFESCHRRKDGSIFHVEISLKVLPEDTGKYVIFLRDINEIKEIAKERIANLRFLERMNIINQAVLETGDFESVSGNILDKIMLLFRCDRAWIINPCNPDTGFWRIKMIRTVPEYPCDLEMDKDIPMDPDLAGEFQVAHEALAPVAFGDGADRPFRGDIKKRFGEKARLVMTFSPSKGDFWLLGIQQCSYQRIWNREEVRLFREICLKLPQCLSKLIAMKNLEQSEEKHRTMINKIQTGVIVHGTDGRILTSNTAAREILEVTEEQLTGKSFTDTTWTFFDENDHVIPVEEQPINRVLATGKPVRNLIGRINRDVQKNNVWFLVNASPVFDEKNKITQIIITFIDISKRKQTEKFLNESETKYRNMVENSLVGVYIVQDYYIKFANSKFMEIFGYPGDEMINRLTAYDLAMSEDKQSVKEKIRQLKSGEIETIEYKIIRGIKKDGKIIFVKAFAGKMIYNGKPAVMGTVIDITDQKKAEDALIEVNKLQKAILDCAGSAVFSTDAEGIIQSFNPAAEQMFGYSARELIGKHTPAIFHDPEEINELASVLSERFNIVLKPGFEVLVIRLKMNLPNYDEWNCIHKNGKKITILINTTAFYNESGEITGFLGIATDITERKQLEEQLQQAQKIEVVGTLASGLAHDFNNILSGITGPLALINYKIDEFQSIDNDKLKEYLSIMQYSCKRASEIIQQLMSLSRHHESVFEPIDINVIIMNVLRLCKSSIDKSIEIKPFHSELPAYISGNQTQIEQVLLNICINGSHAMTLMKESKDNWGGTLSITAGKKIADTTFLNIFPEATEGPYWLISVSDSGVGIKPDDINKIFDPFFTTKENEEGTGLGLAVVYSIIKHHDGFIEVLSEPGEGTTFNIYLPILEDMDAQARLLNKREKIYYGNGKILVADDESNERKVIREFLELCGYDVLSAENGIQCVEIYSKEYNSIKAVVLDMSMPEMSGRDAYIMLKKINPDVKVLLISGNRFDKRVNEIISLGVQRFIEKPLELEKLSMAVHEIIYGR